MVLSSGPASPYEASFMSVFYVTAWLSFMARARKRPCASSGDHAIYEITPFSMLFLRYFQCSFYAIFIEGFTLGILSATLAQPLTTGLPEFRDAVSTPNKKPRLAMEPGPKAQRMQLMLSMDSPSVMAIRALPYPR